MHRRSSFQLLSAWARRERIIKALQCIGVTNLAVFHNKIFQSSYQLETIKRTIHHSHKAGAVQGAALTEKQIKCNQNHNQLALFKRDWHRPQYVEITTQTSSTGRSTEHVYQTNTWPLMQYLRRKNKSDHRGEKQEHNRFNVKLCINFKTCKSNHTSKFILRSLAITSTTCVCWSLQPCAGPFVCILLTDIQLPSFLENPGQGVPYSCLDKHRSIGNQCR